ncbi:MAG: SGNH/GDSL hydrolase family protein, partial [Planctomycetota bacterium]
LVIGDSVTAGMGAGDTTVKWPDQLATKHPWDIANLAQPGAKVSTAVKALQSHPCRVQIAILEIGGNDLLGSTSREVFEANLDELLSMVNRCADKIIMFELPLPPLRNRFGQIQRRLCKRHGAYLIPKRYFVNVLTTEDATIDSVHLTQKGHDQMADLVESIVSSVFKADHKESISFSR